MTRPTSIDRAGPGEFAVPGERRYDRRSPLRWLLSHLGVYRPLVAAFLAGGLLATVCTSLIPRETGRAFDLVLAGGAARGDVLRVALAVLGLVALRGALELITGFSVETLGQRLERDARRELYVSLLGKSQTFHERHRVGDVMARAANDVRQLNPMMNPGVALITESALSLAVPIAFIALIDPRLLLAPLLFVLAFAISLRAYLRQLEPVSTAQREQFGVLNAALNETLTGIMVVKSAVQEGAERVRFARNARLFRDHFVRAGLVQARYLPLLFIGLAAALAFAHGVYLLVNGAITTGDLVAYVGLMSVMRFPAFISIFTFYLVQMGLAGARRILELLTAEVDMDENLGGHAARIDGALEFDGVTFAYDAAGSSPALVDVSFEVAPGQTVAIVGQTGAGKSSVTRLVNRIFDATGGSVRVDGVDVRDWNLEALRSQVSVIEQDVFLFSRTVAENISFGVGAAATRADVVAAAKAAQAHDFIVALEDGYDTVIGERGDTLSGGQRQRLAIARALLTDPRILVLDDSTSAIDSATEDAVQRAIDALLRGRTTLMITHRLAQIRRADLVLMLHGGRLVDSGSHAELLGRNDLYRRMFRRYD